MADGQILVSVVLPVYNSEKYLDKCIGSLLSQTLKNVEFIFVDDGSTDDSVKIIRDYQSRDPRILLLQQKNQFAGVARNNGMAIAQGKYIIFLDSDDFFENNLLEEMYRAAEESGAQIVVCGYDNFDNLTGDYGKVWLPCTQGVCSAKTLGKRIFRETSPNPWNKLIQRDFLLETGFQFQALRNTNDVFLTRTICAVADSIFFVQKVLVHYRKNNSNSLQGLLTQTDFCFGEAFVSVKDELKTRKLFSEEMAEAFFVEVEEVIRYFLSRQGSAETYEKCFLYSRELLNNLRAREEWSEVETKTPILDSIMRSETTVQFLWKEKARVEKELADERKRQWREIEAIYNSTISKQSLTYKVGRIALFIPGRIKTIIQKLKERLQCLRLV